MRASGPCRIALPPRQHSRATPVSPVEKTSAVAARPLPLDRLVCAALALFGGVLSPLFNSAVVSRASTAPGHPRGARGGCRPGCRNRSTYASDDFIDLLISAKAIGVFSFPVRRRVSRCSSNRSNASDVIPLTASMRARLTGPAILGLFTGSRSGPARSFTGTRSPVFVMLLAHGIPQQRCLVRRVLPLAVPRDRSPGRPPIYLPGDGSLLNPARSNDPHGDAPAVFEHGSFGGPIALQFRLTFVGTHSGPRARRTAARDSGASSMIACRGAPGYLRNPAAPWRGAAILGGHHASGGRLAPTAMAVLAFPVVTSMAPRHSSPRSSSTCALARLGAGPAVYGRVIMLLWNLGPCARALRDARTPDRTHGVDELPVARANHYLLFFGF